MKFLYLISVEMASNLSEIEKLLLAACDNNNDFSMVLRFISPLYLPSIKTVR